MIIKGSNQIAEHTIKYKLFVPIVDSENNKIQYHAKELQKRRKWFPLNIKKLFGELLVNEPLLLVFSCCNSYNYFNNQILPDWTNNN